MRTMLSFFFLVSFLPACSNTTTIEDPPGTGGSGGSGNSSSSSSSSGSGGSGGSGPEVPAEAITIVCDLVRTACEKQVACGHPILNTASDVESCMQAQQCESITQILASPDYFLDKDAVAVCTNVLNSATCGALVTQGLDIATACQHYIVGTRLEGELCRGGVISDCAAGLVCDGVTCPGTCKREISDFCAEGSCGADKFCAADGTCRSRGLIGQACDESQLEFNNLRDGTCVAGAHCDNLVCVADLKPGAQCAGQVPTACGPTATCQCPDPAQCGTPDAFVCVEASDQNEPCNWALDCKPGLFCDFSAANGAVCAKRAGLGDPCTDSYGACMHPLACVNGKCSDESAPPISEIPLLSEGDNCVFEGSCPLGTTCTCTTDTCVDKTCQKAPALGESCSAQLQANLTPFACREGLCDLLGNQTCVLPAAAGEPCAIDGSTFACASTVCRNGKCAAYEDLRCPE